MTAPSQRQFWDCDEIIRWDYSPCYDHYTEYLKGNINECPQCDSYKYAEYDVCINCYQQGHTVWQRLAVAATVIMLNAGNYYIGQTSAMYAWLHEHRNNMSQSTRGQGTQVAMARHGSSAQRCG